MIEVKSSQRKDSAKGVWLVLSYLNDKGENKTANIFDKTIVAQFKGPGKYEVKWVKSDKGYFNISEMALTEAAAAPAPANGAASPSIQAAPGILPAAASSRALIAAHAMSAAAVIVAAMVGKGTGLPDADATGELVKAYAKMLRDDAVVYLTGKVEAPKQTATVEGA